MKYGIYITAEDNMIPAASQTAAMKLARFPETLLVQIGTLWKSEQTQSASNPTNCTGQTQRTRDLLLSVPD